MNRVELIQQLQTADKSLPVFVGDLPLIRVDYSCKEIVLVSACGAEPPPVPAKPVRKPGQTVKEFYASLPPYKAQRRAARRLQKIYQPPTLTVADLLHKLHGLPVYAESYPVRTRRAHKPPRHLKGSLCFALREAQATDEQLTLISATCGGELSADSIATVEHTIAHFAKQLLPKLRPFAVYALDGVVEAAGLNPLSSADRNKVRKALDRLNKLGAVQIGQCENTFSKRGKRPFSYTVTSLNATNTSLS